ncbi:MAG: hypothetical protein KBT01_08245 [Clostridiales bacterium]|nr:hypothetical protein [Candidatus Blautia equi]
MNSEETAATFCSYCGASVQLQSRIGKEKRPAKIIPFSIDEKQCQESFRNRMKRAVFAPGYLRKESEMSKLRGIYMPYWSYGFSVDQEIHANAYTEKRKGDYIITDHYHLVANAKGSYDGISFDSASNFYDDISERISPFDTRQAKDFNPAYMSGFYADKGDVASEVYLNDAKDYLKEDVSTSFSNLPEFEGLTMDKSKLSAKIQPENAKNDFVLYPVWFLTNHFGKNRVTYAVANGQNGKIAADIPIDPKKYLLISLLVAIPLFFLLELLPTLEPTEMIVAAMILHLISTAISIYQGMTIQKREFHGNDKGFQSAGSGETEKKRSYKFKWYLYIYHVALLLAGVFLYFYRSMSDYAYYACCAAIMIGVAITFISIIKQHNILSTHKLPQLGKRGGDEHEY